MEKNLISIKIKGLIQQKIEEFQLLSINPRRHQLSQTEFYVQVHTSAIPIRS